MFHLWISSMSVISGFLCLWCSTENWCLKQGPACHFFYFTSGDLMIEKEKVIDRRKYYFSVGAYKWLFSCVLLYVWDSAGRRNHVLLFAINKYMINPIKTSFNQQELSYRAGSRLWSMSYFSPYPKETSARAIWCKKRLYRAACTLCSCKSKKIWPLGERRIKK